MPDDRCYQAAVTAAIQIADMLGPWPGIERPLVIGRITFLLLDVLKQHAASGSSPGVAFDLD
jgi:hypothetical protein